MTAGDRQDLRAVIFDVDGTLVDSERHGHRVAFNMAFEEFGLPYRWDEDEYGMLLRTTGGRRRIDGYLKSKGVEESERERLVPVLHERKTEMMSELVEAGRVEVRPGVERLLHELSEDGLVLAVGTTGSRGWVEKLLKRLVPDTNFDVIVTGDDVENRKPDPEVFAVALDRLKVGVDEAVVVEDSAEGVEAAAAQGLPCVAVVNGYTADHDLSGAQVILDGFGEPNAPAKVIVDRVGTGCEGVLDAAVLRALLAGARRKTERDVG